MLNALILMPLSNDSESGLVRLLKQLPSLDGECGFKRGRTPRQPTINHFNHRIGLQGFKRIFSHIKCKKLANFCPVIEEEMELGLMKAIARIMRKPELIKRLMLGSPLFK